MKTPNWIGEEIVVKTQILLIITQFALHFFNDQGIDPAEAVDQLYDLMQENNGVSKKAKKVHKT
jgi:hypothetical protein